VISEHIGFSVWTLWSVMVLFMGPEYGIDAAGKFFLVAVPTLVGAVLRLPYTFAVAKFGGRNWTIVSAALLLVPTVLAAIVMHPGTSYTTFMVVACFAGLGGGNFASSMTNINAFFPERYKGWALGLNAGGGNIGVPVIQLIALLIIATAGAAYPRLILVIYIPLIVVAAVLSAIFMDNISSVRNDTGAFKESIREHHTWIMAFLYIGTFGSFIGYSFAFGLVLQNQFGRTPLQAASITFIGPLLGSLIRPVGGRLADRFGGARVTFLNFIGMVAASAVVLAGSAAQSLAIYALGFILLFVLTGVGNGSTYKMIPAIFKTEAERIGEAGSPEREAAMLNATKRASAAIGIIGAVGALGGFLIPITFSSPWVTAPMEATKTAFMIFTAFYVVCAAVTWFVYLRNPHPARAHLSYAGVGI
jgi:NNP family nitrate/nitrite transporter-like MFS transporter